MLLDRIGPPGRCSGCWRRPRRSQLRGQLRHDPIAPAGQGGSGVLSLRHFGLVLFIPWRVGAEESGAAKNGLRAQHLNNALTECLKWGALTSSVTVARARELFLNSQGRRDAARPDRGCSGCWRRPRRAQLRGQLRHDPIAPGWLGGLRRAFAPAFRAGSLYPLARGCRRIWRGEIWKYGFGGAVVDLGLLISGSRRRPRRSQLRGQLRHDRSQQLAGGATACFLSGIFGLALSLNPLARGCRRIWRGEI